MSPGLAWLWSLRWGLLCAKQSWRTASLEASQPYHSLASPSGYAILLFTRAQLLWDSPRRAGARPSSGIFPRTLSVVDWCSGDAWSRGDPRGTSQVLEEQTLDFYIIGGAAFLVMEILKRIDIYIK